MCHEISIFLLILADLPVFSTFPPLPKINFFFNFDIFCEALNKCIGFVRFSVFLYLLRTRWGPPFCTDISLF